MRLKFDRLFPLTVLFLLNIGDAVLTHAALRSGSFAEGNPIMGWVIAHGFHWMYLVKISVMVLCCGVYYAIWDRHRMVAYATWFLVMLYCLILSWNVGNMLYYDW